MPLCFPSSLMEMFEGVWVDSRLLPAPPRKSWDLLSQLFPCWGWLEKPICSTGLRASYESAEKNGDTKSKSMELFCGSAARAAAEFRTVDPGPTSGLNLMAKFRQVPSADPGNKGQPCQEQGAVFHPVGSHKEYIHPLAKPSSLSSCVENSV